MRLVLVSPHWNVRKERRVLTREGDHGGELLTGSPRTVVDARRY
jgi:hypothetical protein